MSTRIEWCTETWPVVNGCSPVSRGCDNCWAARLLATRLKHRPQYQGLSRMEGGRPQWAGKVRCAWGLLEQPLHWRKPRLIFVAPHGDLFHPRVPSTFIESVFGVMARACRHTFLVLTKRPNRLLDWAREGNTGEFVESYPTDGNAWMGVSVEDQETAEQRIPPLLRCPAVRHWISYEPALGPLDCGPWLSSLGWIVIGCESGKARRPCELDWVYRIAGQAKEARVPVFIKQLPINGRVSHVPAAWPASLRLQDVPQ